MSDDSEPDLRLRRGLVISFFVVVALLFGCCALFCALWSGLEWFVQVTDPRKVHGVWANKHGAKITIREDGSVLAQSIHCKVLHGPRCTERRDYAGTWNMAQNGVQFDLRQIQGDDNMSLTVRVSQLWGRRELRFFTEAEDASEFVFVREGP